MASDSTQPLILVVDDEPPIREMARRILEKAGYNVTEAANGWDAIAVIDKQTPIDLLMADLDMPELGGEEMARQIRARRPDLRVLYVTAHVDRLFEERPLLWEGEAFLDKPFTAVGLLEAVSLILHGTTRRRATS